MKRSAYTYIFNENGFGYWYNGISNAFFKLPETISTKLEKLLDTPEVIEKQIPTFYIKLVDQGFIINDDINELEYIHKRQQNQIDTKNCMMVLIPTMNCNYSCWYCVQSHVPSLMSEETKEKILLFIQKKIESGDIETLQIEWFGGEPFMQFKKIVKPLGEKINQLCRNYKIPVTQSATTNGYFLTQPIVNDLKNLGFKMFQITLDGDREHHNKIKYQDRCESTFDHVLNNIKNILLESDDMQVLLRINYDYSNISPEILNQVNEIIPKEIRNRIIIFPQKVWQAKPNHEKSVELFELWKQFKKVGYGFRHPLINNGGESCYVNRKNYVTINYNGDVVKCTSDGNFEQDGLIKPGKIDSNGNLTWEDNICEILTKPTGRSKRCTLCRFLPLCYGPCPKFLLNNDEEYCKMEQGDLTYKDAIIEYIELMTQ